MRDCWIHIDCRQETEITLHEPGGLRIETPLNVDVHNKVEYIQRENFNKYLYNALSEVNYLQV